MKAAYSWGSFFPGFQSPEGNMSAQHTLGPYAWTGQLPCQALCQISLFPSPGDTGQYVKGTSERSSKLPNHLFPQQ